MIVSSKSNGADFYLSLHPPAGSSARQTKGASSLWTEGWMTQVMDHLPFKVTAASERLLKRKQWGGNHAINHSFENNCGVLIMRYGAHFLNDTNLVSTYKQHWVAKKNYIQKRWYAKNQISLEENTFLRKSDRSDWNSFQICLLLAVESWTSYFTSLCLSFPICKYD